CLEGGDAGQIAAQHLAAPLRTGEGAKIDQIRAAAEEEQFASQQSHVGVGGKEPGDAGDGGPRVAAEELAREGEILGDAGGGAAGEGEVGNLLGPGDALQVGERLLPELRPERLVVAEGYALLIIAYRADAVEAVLAPEVGVAGEFDEA